jgi:signal transduction histidine kinase
MEAIHSAISDLHEIGLVDEPTMKQFDDSCLRSIERLGSEEHLSVSRSAIRVLEDRKRDIVDRWERRVTEPTGPARAQGSLILRDDLEGFLHCIADALTADREPESHAQDSTELGTRHGLQRAGLEDFPLRQVVLELHALRVVLTEVLDEEGVELSRKERETIHSAFDHYLLEAASAYSKTVEERRQSEVVTIVHDLRSPVATVLTAAEMIQRAPNKATWSRESFAELAREKMLTLRQRLRDVLDSSKLESGGRLSRYERCDLAEIAESVAGEMRLEHGAVIAFSADGDVQGVWSKDEIRRCVENLVSNACKYRAPDSPVTVRVGERGSDVCLWCRNFGEPIPEEDMGRLFEKFQRADRPREDRGGWGLGLFLVATIVHRHGGSVNVTSDEQNGTAFSITLPKSPPDR